MTESIRNNAQPGNYERLRVIDFTHALAGPYSTKLMADMGAEVIKVEPPVIGDNTRRSPYIRNGASGSFMWRNAGKKSLCLDLKRPAAVEIFQYLAKVSDVVVQNMKVGVMDRLGLGYDELKAVNPKIIMCSVSGFGLTGPMSDQPGWDMRIQAISGAMAIGGHADGPPLPAWVPWVDFATGTHAIAAVGSALYYREMTGVGQHIDVSMLDCAFGYHDFATQEYLLSDGEVHRTRTGGMHPSLALLGVFECKDGYLLINVRNWQRMTGVMGRPELANDPRFDSQAHRDQNKDEANGLFAEWIKNFDITDATRLMDQAGGRATPILSIEEVVHHPQIQAREMLVEADDPRAGKVKLPNTPFRFSETKARVRGRAPLLGEHNEEILRGILGYGEERVKQLWEDKVLYAEEAAFNLAGS